METSWQGGWSHWYLSFKVRGNVKVIIILYIYMMSKFSVCVYKQSMWLILLRATSNQQFGKHFQKYCVSLSVSCTCPALFLTCYGFLNVTLVKNLIRFISVWKDSIIMRIIPLVYLEQMFFFILWTHFHQETTLFQVWDNKDRCHQVCMPRKRRVNRKRSCCPGYRLLISTLH